jgi:phage gp36-like protein
MYCTLEDLLRLQPEKILLQNADDDNAGEFVLVPPNGAYRNIVSHVENADAVIDSYLSGRYAVPLADPVPPIVRQISANLALVGLYGRRRELDVPEGLAARSKRYMQLLKDIKSELAGIPELAGNKKSPAIVSVNKTDEDRLFSDSLLSQY